jgi:hypothetical protein
MVSFSALGNSTSTNPRWAPPRRCPAASAPASPAAASPPRAGGLGDRRRFFELRAFLIVPDSTAGGARGHDHAGAAFAAAQTADEKVPRIEDLPKHDLCRGPRG